MMSFPIKVTFCQQFGPNEKKKKMRGSKEKQSWQNGEHDIWQDPLLSYKRLQRVFLISLQVKC